MTSNTSPPTALELACELRALCRNFEPSFRLIGNMRGDDIERVAVAVLDLTAQLAASQRESDRLRHGVPVEGDLVCPAETELAELRRYVAHNDEEYKTMKDVLRAEHAVCQELRDTVARLTGELSAAKREAERMYSVYERSHNCQERERLTTQRDCLRSALKELAEWAMTSVQCASQHADYRDDPEWQRAERAARLAADKETP